MTKLDWAKIHKELWEQGWAHTEQVLTAEQCAELAALYPHDQHFRSRIIMARHQFGRGEYKYFNYPLPKPVAALRHTAYAELAPLANEWSQALGLDAVYPKKHEEFLQLCHEQGQARPTPLLLHYEEGDYNCLHQDLYGAVFFPFQMACFLNKRNQDYDGGEFVLVEQRPRAQSVPQVIQPEQGEAVIFTTRWRPVRGTRGFYRANVKHGVSRITRGSRNTLGIVFHDAA
jgi:hypothetical protein